MMFMAMVMISMYFTEMVIEKRYSTLWTVIFSVVAVLATNVRIVGAIFPVLLFIYIWLEWFLGEKVKGTLFRAFKTSLLIVAVYLEIYILIMPSLWENPVRGIIAFLPWLAMVIAHSTLYNGWRHCYFWLPPLVFFPLQNLS